jgi:thiol-disulfide isomerase/thioredoxin
LLRHPFFNFNGTLRLAAAETDRQKRLKKTKLSLNLQTVQNLANFLTVFTKVNHCFLTLNYGIRVAAYSSRKPIMTTLRIKILFSLLLLAAPLHAEELAPVNKLRYMYQFYYLPFSLEFREGKTVNDIMPFISNNAGDLTQLVKAAELQSLDGEWNEIKNNWQKKSLLLNTVVGLNKTVRISPHLISHRIALNHKPLDGVALTERIQIERLLSNQSPDTQASFKQMRFLKSFMTPADEYRFNFFLVSASWCESCKEYRLLFESYLKSFPDSNLTLHSVVVEDPKEEIFDSQLLKDLFPHPAKYTHDSIPRFLAIDQANGRLTVYEEGEALKEVYERFFKSHQGYLNQRVKLFKNIPGHANTDLQTTLSSIVR